MIGQPYFAAQVGWGDGQPAIRTRGAWALTIVVAGVQGRTPAGATRLSVTSLGFPQPHGRYGRSRGGEHCYSGKRGRTSASEHQPAPYETA